MSYPAASSVPSRAIEVILFSLSAGFVAFVLVYEVSAASRGLGNVQAFAVMLLPGTLFFSAGAMAMRRRKALARVRSEFLEGLSSNV